MMMTFWFWIYGLSLLLLIVNLFVLKNSRDTLYNEPVLKIWHIVGLIIVFLIPFLNLAVLLTMSIMLIMAYDTKDYRWKPLDSNNKFTNWLNKTVK